jgi:hypothetical protein
MSDRTIYERLQYNVDGRAAYLERIERERAEKEQKDRELLAAEIAKALVEVLRGEKPLSW